MRGFGLGELLFLLGLETLFLDDISTGAMIGQCGGAVWSGARRRVKDRVMLD